MEAATGTTAASADPLRWKALTVVCAAFFMTILDVSIVNVALPSIGTSLALLGGEPAVGDHGVRDHLWRLPPALWAPRRPVRAPAALHDRRGHLHDRLPLLRAGLVGGRPDRLTCRTGARGGGHHAVGALDRDDDLRRGRRAKQGARDLGSARRRRRRGRRARRRNPHDLPELALDLLGQRPRRRGRLLPHHPCRAREPRRGEEGAGRRRRGDRHRRPRAARLRGHEGTRPRLDVGLDAEPAGRGRPAPARVRRHRGAGEGSADAVPRSSGSRRSRARTSAGSCWARSRSRTSSSSRSTCSRCSVTARSRRG